MFEFKSLNLIILSQTFVSLVSVAKNIDSAEYGYDYSEEYIGYDADGDGGEVLEFVPEFVTQPSQLKVSLGSTARLNCIVKDLGPTTISWRKGDLNDSYEATYVAVGPTLLTTDPRFTVNVSQHGSTLQILLVQDQDQGIYQGQVFSHPPVYLTHSLAIKRAPVVSVLGKPPSGVLELQEGQELALVCRGQGDPPPQIHWSRQNKRLVDGSRRIAGDQIIYTRVSRKHSGVYVCEGDNGFGAPSRDFITVNVQYEPLVSLEGDYIHQSQSSQLELICSVQGEPEPEIKWSGIHLGPNTKLTKRRKGKEVLLVKNVKMISSGSIVCSAFNSRGQSWAVFNITDGLMPRYDTRGNPVKIGSLVTKRQQVTNRPNSFSNVRYKPAAATTTTSTTTTITTTTTTTTTKTTKTTTTATTTTKATTSSATKTPTKSNKVLKHQELLKLKQVQTISELSDSMKLLSDRNLGGPAVDLEMLKSIKGIEKTVASILELQSISLDTLLDIKRS